MNPEYSSTLKRNEVLICVEANKSQKWCPESKKPGTQHHVLHDFIDSKYPEQANPETESRVLKREGYTCMYVIMPDLS